MRSRGGSGAYGGNMAKDEGEVKIDQWDGPTLDAIEAALSTDRFTKYVDACGGDRKAAFRLYGWNTAISAAFYGPLQTLEVTLRNALNASLSAQYGATWYDAAGPGLDAHALKKIDESKRGLAKQGHPIDAPHMVANLSFGFWVSLLGAGGRRQPPAPKANYEMTLWRPALRRAFPGAPKLNRKAAHSPFEHMRLLRNRIAHHEPVHARRLDKDYESILKVLEWMSPEARTWVKASSRIPDLLAQFKDSEHVKF